MNASRIVTPIIVAIVTIALVALPAGRAPDFGSVITFLVPFFATTAIFAILSIGLNIQWGYTGIINFGVVGFFMIGAYTAGIFTKEPASSEFVQYIGGFGEALAFLPFLNSGSWLPFVIGILAAGLLSAVLALLLAAPTLRLREDYLAIATIGVAEVLRRVTIEEEWLVNGTRGLTAIPRPFAGWVAPNQYNLLFLAFVLLIVVILFFLVERGIRSPWGRVLRALREDEEVTAASGKNIFAFKMQAFVFGAVVMGIGGALFAYQQSTISPDTFTHFFGTFIIWAMLIVGGSGNNLGAITGAYVIWGLWSMTLQLQGYPLPEFLASRIFYLRDFLLGALIVLVLLIQPRGLVPEQARVSRWVQGGLRRPAKPA